MRNRRSSAMTFFPAALILLFTMLLCLSAFLIGGRLTFGASDSTPAEGRPYGAVPIRVVIDAGHGGEDGGAVSADGLLEKDVNLNVAFLLRDYLEAAGVPVVMTRTEDKLLYGRTADPGGRKKMLDLNTRLHIALDVTDSLLVSIHMNSYPDPRCSGMQVWYSTGDPKSMDAASAIQSTSILLSPDNHRRIKAADRSIFILDRLTSPGVLVECGFLSNPSEAARLGTEEYQRETAFAIFSGIMSFLSQQKTGA